MNHQAVFKNYAKACSLEFNHCTLRESVLPTAPRLCSLTSGRSECRQLTVLPGVISSKK